jgi:hypothetical protein
MIHDGYIIVSYSFFFLMSCIFLMKPYIFFLFLLGRTWSMTSMEQRLLGIARRDPSVTLFLSHIFLKIQFIR